MRKRNFAIGTAAVLALSVAVSGTAQAAGTLAGQDIFIQALSPKLDKKKKIGPVNSLTVRVDTRYNGSTPPFQGKATNTKIDFPRDFAFKTAGVPQCDPNSPGFGASTTEAAIAACGPAQIGTGSANLAGAVAGVTANVTAFNGTTPAGFPTVLLHSRTTAGTTTVLVGTLRISDQGVRYGNVLDVVVPILPLGFVITKFETTIPKKVVKKAVKKKVNKNTGKVIRKGKPAQFYISARCSTNTWDFQARSTYTDGVPSTVANTTAACKGKKAKKK